MVELERLVYKEVSIINAVFKQNGIQAGVGMQDVIVFHPVMIRYNLQYAPNVDESKIQKVMLKIKRELQAFRQNDELPIIYNSEKLFIEIDHPNKQPLGFNLWDIKNFKGNAHKVCVGKVYGTTKSVDKYIDLVKSPHLLVAGVTGTGKSIQLDNILISLLYSTSPIELEVYLIDFKNKALAAYKDAFHVKEYAISMEHAIKVIRHVDNELRKKILDRSYKPNTRIVLVIDEYADFTHEKNNPVIEPIKRIVSKGREDNVNLILSTQHPSQAVLGDAVIQRNIGTRVVGHVTDKDASDVATKRSDLHCEDLPYPGVFYVVDNGKVYKSFSYFITPELKHRLIEAINAQWRLDWLDYQETLDNQLTSYNQLSDTYVDTVENSVETHVPMVVSPVITSYNQLSAGASGYAPVMSIDDMFPIKQGRPLTEDECRHFHTLKQLGEFDTNGKYSRNKAISKVYGSKNDERVEWIKLAEQYNPSEVVADPKIIKLKRTGT